MLLLVAVLTGFLTTFVIRRTTDTTALRDTRNQIQAHLLEFRLFFDEPGLIWRAQISLLRDNLSLAKLLLLPTLLLAVPMTYVVWQLDAVYGRRPLRAGEAAIVTVRLTHPIRSADRFDLQADPGIKVETPPIRILHDNQVAWRIRATSNIPGAVNLTMNGRSISKTIAAGDSLAPLLLPMPFRHPLAELTVDYPPSDSAWAAWFLSVSAVAALLSIRLYGR